jgi:hypothetical protein
MAIGPDDPAELLKTSNTPGLAMWVVTQDSSIANLYCEAEFRQVVPFAAMATVVVADPGHETDAAPEAVTQTLTDLTLSVGMVGVNEIA